MGRRMRHFLGWPRWRMMWMSAVVLIGGGGLMTFLNVRSHRGAAIVGEFDAPWASRTPTLHRIGDGPPWPETLFFLHDAAFHLELEKTREDGKYSVVVWKSGFVGVAGDEITATNGVDRTSSRVVISGQGGASGTSYRIGRYRWGAPLRWVETWTCDARQGPPPPRSEWREYDRLAGAANIGMCLFVFAAPLFGPTLFISLRRRRRGRCPACGYDLRGDLSAGCTECGWNRDIEPALIDRS